MKVWIDGIQYIPLEAPSVAKERPLQVGDFVQIIACNFYPEVVGAVGQIVGWYTFPPGCPLVYLPAHGHSPYAAYTDLPHRDYLWAIIPAHLRVIVAGPWRSDYATA